MSSLPPRNPYETASFERSLHLGVSAQTDGNASTATLVLESFEGTELLMEVMLDVGQGAATMRAEGPEFNYYWWLGGDEVPFIEGHARGRSFAGPAGTKLQGLQALDRHLPRRIRGLLEVFRPDIETAFESVTPSELDDPEVEGPGAWRLKPDWWHRWKEVKHQCAGLANAATWICCAVGGAPGLVIVNPIVIGAGTAIGCIFGAYVTGVAGSMCQENVIRRVE